MGGVWGLLTSKRDASPFSTKLLAPSEMTCTLQGGLKWQGKPGLVLSPVQVPSDLWLKRRLIDRMTLGDEDGGCGEQDSCPSLISIPVLLRGPQVTSVPYAWDLCA